MSSFFKKKRVCIFACLFLLIAVSVGGVCAGAATYDASSVSGSLSEGRGFVYADNLHLERDLEIQPMTYEAVVYLPKSVNTASTVFGNFNRVEVPGFNFQISQSGEPQLYIVDAEKNVKLSTFDCDVRGESWVHIAITHSFTQDGAVFTCYVNGSPVGTVESSSRFELDMSVVQNPVTPYLGKDFRNDSYFRGRIKSLALYSEVLSASEIASSYASGVNSADESVIAYYDLTSSADSTFIEDLSGGGYNFSPLYFEREGELGDYAYSFAVIGDTQYLVKKDATDGTSYSSYIFDWIVKNKDSKNIQFVMGLGDITDGNTDGEWAVAKDVYEKLTAAGIKYSAVRGNHDTVAQFDNYFAGNSNFTNMDTQYFSTNSLGNYYVRFTVGETKYMVLCLDYQIESGSDAMLWANTAIEQNPDHKVIITTHSYLLHTGKRYYEDMWESFVTYNKNVIMVLSGHVNYTNNIVRTYSVGKAGHTVAELLINPQYIDSVFSHNKTSMIAMLYFSADGKKVNVEYVSGKKTLDAQQENENAKDVLFGSKNQFSFTLADEPVSVTTKYGVITNSEWADSSVYPFVIFDENGNCIGAATEFMGKGSSDSAINQAKTYLSGNNWSGGKPTGTARSATILMRANHSTPNHYYDNTSQIEGLLTVDLNGYTLSAPTNSSGNYPLLRVKLKTTGYPTEIVFKNGNINLYNQELFALYGNVSGKVFKAGFENVNFKFNKAATGFMAKYSTCDYDIYPEIYFTDCVIDLSGSTASSNITLFNVGSDKAHTSVTVNGGSVIGGGKSFTFFGKSNEASNGTLVFKEYNESYTAVTVPDGSVPTSEIISNGTDNLVLAKYSDDAGNDVYRMTYEYVETKYGRIPAEYTFTDKYPFVVFDENGTCFHAAPYLYGTGKSDSAINQAKAYVAKNAWDGESYGQSEATAVILMRCDYTIASGEYYDNISQVRGTVTLDLDGYKLTRAGSDALVRTTLKSWSGVFPTELVFKNGSIDLKNGALTKFYASAEGKAFTIKFVDVYFTVTGTAANFAATHTGGTVSGLTPNMQFENCVIDITSAKTEDILLFDLGNAKTSLTVNMVGCEIKASNNKFKLFSKAEAASTGAFIPKDTDEGYNVLTLPKGTAVIEQDGVELVRISENESEISYRIKEKLSVGFTYTPKSSITLGSELVYNLYVPINGLLKSFTVDGRVIENAESVELDDGNFYYLVRVKLPASDAARDVNLKVTVTFEGKDYIGTWMMSIPKYAETVINSSELEKEISLVKNVLSYIREAHVYWNKESDKLALIDALLGADYDANNTPDMSSSVNAAAPSGTGFTGVTLHLGDAPSYRFYYEGANAPEYVFTVGSKTVTPTLGEDESGKKYLEIKVYAYEMLLGVAFGNYTYSAYTYYNFARSSGMTREMALVERLVKYCESAEAYRLSVAK